MTNEEHPEVTEEAPRDEDERVDEASEESFPASDPPASWAGGDVETP